MFRLGPIRFNLYGVMFALGVLAATFLAVREAAKKGIAKDVIYDLTFVTLIGAIVGARAFYVLFYWPDGVPLTILGALKIWEGGVAFIGGFIGGLIAGYLFVRKRGLRFWMLTDVFTVPLIVGHIIGRIGDYLTGGHPGKPTSLPWAIYLDGAPRHPVVLYEILGLMIIGIVIVALKKIRRFDGLLFLAYVQMYAVQRIVLDFFRLDSTDPRFLGLTPTQYAVIVSFTLAAVLLIGKGRRFRRETIS